MQFLINRDVLLKPLAQLSNIIERRQTSPILANILMEVEPGLLRLVATDLELELETVVDCSVETSAQFTVPARKLSDIIKALPDNEPVQFAVENERITLKTGRGRYRLGTLAAQDYPRLEGDVAGQHITLERDTIAKLLGKTQFAMAHQDVRYYLNGLQLEIGSRWIRAVATDGHRLALSESYRQNESDEEIQVLLPRKAVLELSRLLSEKEGKIDLEVGATHLKIKAGNTTFVTKLIDGRFPDYERAMPQSDFNDLIVDRVQLREALVRTSILSNEEYRSIRFELKKGLVRLEANNPAQDEAVEEIEVVYEGEPIIVGFNVGYLLDVLGAIEDEQVRMSIIDKNSSCLVMGMEETNSKYVIMPMRL